MRKRVCLTAMVVAWGLAVGGPVALGAHIFEGFESYDIIGLPEGVTEGANYLSAGGDPTIHHIGPTWSRFGAAVSDGVFVSNRSADVISGSQSGMVYADWTLGDNLSAVYLTNGVDLTTYTGYQIDARSGGATGNQGAGLVAIFSGTVAGQSQVWVADLNAVSPQSVTGMVNTFEFAFDESLYEEVNVNAADADFLGTLSNLDWIGIQIHQEGSLGSEIFSLDNLRLVPEPGSSALLVGGLLILATRRRSGLA